MFKIWYNLGNFALAFCFTFFNVPETLKKKCEQKTSRVFGNSHYFQVILTSKRPVHWERDANRWFLLWEEPSGFKVTTQAAGTSSQLVFPNISAAHRDEPLCIFYY